MESLKKKNKIGGKRLMYVVGFLTLFVTWFLNYNGVDNTITSEDEVYISKILGENLEHSVSTYEDEIMLIKCAQKSVLEIAPINKGIPEGKAREPKDLYIFRKGLCYDRSRVIEKILRAKGLKTRHISVFSLKKANSKFGAIAGVGTESHALLEVLTQKGWMFIDSNDYFLGLDDNDNPISLMYLQEKGFNNLNWNSYNNLNYKVIYKTDFTFVYGLYSRHGKFYPPYNFIPDINWKEFTYNII